LRRGWLWSQHLLVLAGTVSVTVNLDEAASESIKLNYELSGDAVLNGDYSVDSSSQITIAAGSKTAALKFTIFNDAVVEENKAIHIKFSSSSNISLTDAEATVTIEDDDTSQSADGLQTDLVWDGGTLVNLDLYSANNVTISNDSVTNFDLVSGSENTTGFESVLINNSEPDGEYYFIVSYSSGSRAVNYTLNANGPGITDAASDGSFTASNSGYAYFYGPVTKSGSSYTRQSGSVFNLKGVKSYAYKGKIRK